MRVFIWFVECLFLSVPCREKEQAAREEVDKKEAERQVWFQACRTGRRDSSNSRIICSLRYISQQQTLFHINYLEY